MELKDMTLVDVETRLAELAADVETMTEEEPIKAATEEKRSLIERKAELEAIETRKKEAEALASGEAFGKTIEKREDSKMENFAIESVEYRNAWLACLMNKANEEQRTAVTGAAAVIPTTTLDKIVTRIKENKLIAKCDIISVPGYIRVPVYGTKNAASWATTAQDSEDSISYIDLKPYQLIKTLEITADVDKMSINAFETYIVEQLVNAMETAIQKAILVGTGSANSQPKGIITDLSTPTGTFTKAAVTKADLLTIMGKLPGDYQNGAVWVMPAAVFYGEVMNIANYSTFVNVNDGFEKKLFGHDVILDDECIVSSTDNILYGNAKHYHLNFGENINVAKDTSLGFRSNSVVYRAVAQCDGMLDNTAAFVRYTRSTT